MSFSQDVKNELCHLPLQKTCCMKAELAGLLSFCGKMVTEQGRAALRLRTENAAVARRLYSLLKQLYRIRLDIVPGKHTGGATAFTMKLTDENHLNQILGRLGLMQGRLVRFGIDPFLVQEECCARSYLRGAFLGGGSVSSPERSYHFEIETHYYGLSGALMALMTDMEIPVGTVVRKSSYVTYIKDSEVIGDVLALMGATDSMMELLNVKIVKDVKNTVNRRVNCETANLTKTANAAVQQIRCIEKIFEKEGKSALPDGLRELAELRLENPEASLAELGEMLTPPISKSGVNHRLKKLMRMAEEL